MTKAELQRLKERVLEEVRLALRCVPFDSTEQYVKDVRKEIEFAVRSGVEEEPVKWTVEVEEQSPTLKTLEAVRIGKDDGAKVAATIVLEPTEGDWKIQLSIRCVPVSSVGMPPDLRATFEKGDLRRSLHKRT